MVFCYYRQFSFCLTKNELVHVPVLQYMYTSKIFHDVKFKQSFLTILVSRYTKDVCIIKLYSTITIYEFLC